MIFVWGGEKATSTHIYANVFQVKPFLLSRSLCLPPRVYSLYLYVLNVTKHADPDPYSYTMWGMQHRPCTNVLCDPVVFLFQYGHWNSIGKTRASCLQMTSNPHFIFSTFHLELKTYAAENIFTHPPRPYRTHPSTTSNPFFFPK